MKDILHIKALLHFDIPITHESKVESNELTAK